MICLLLTLFCVIKIGCHTLRTRIQKIEIQRGHAGSHRGTHEDLSLNYGGDRSDVENLHTQTCCASTPYSALKKKSSTESPLIFSEINSRNGAISLLEAATFWSSLLILPLAVSCGYFLYSLLPNFISQPAYFFKREPLSLCYAVLKQQ